MKLSDILTRRNTERFTLRGTLIYDPAELAKLIDDAITANAPRIKDPTWVRAEALALLEPAYRKIAPYITTHPTVHERHFTMLVDKTIAMLGWGGSEESFLSAQSRLDENFNKATLDVVEKGLEWAVGYAFDFTLRHFPGAYALLELEWLWTWGREEFFTRNQGLREAVRKAGVDAYKRNPNAVAIDVWSAMDKAAEAYTANRILPRVLGWMSK